MKHGDTGSLFTRGLGDSDHPGGYDPRGLERLEDRVLLSSTPVTLDPDGAAVVAGSLGFGDVVFYEFTTPNYAAGMDFVRILADANTAGDDLDTALGLYTADDIQSARAKDAFGRTITQATGNGTLEGGTPTDAWLGAVLEANTTYYIAVSSNSLMATTGAGDFFLRINAVSTSVDITADARTLVQSGPNDQTDIITRGTDLMFRIETGVTDAFDSLITANAVADPAALDTRLDIYDGQGRLIVGNSDGGRVGNAFTAWRAGQSETYYVRVRSDQFLNLSTATGEFTLVLETQATDLNVDPVTRLGYADDVLLSDIEITGEGSSGVNAHRSRSDSRLFRFTAQSTGAAVVSARAFGIEGIAGGLASDNVPGYENIDIKLRVYDPDGNLVLVADDIFSLVNVSPYAEFQVIGGQDYFLVVDNFEFAAPQVDINFRIAIDASTNLERTPGTQELLQDDHPGLPADDGSLTEEERRRLADQATPIPWNRPEELFTDRGYVQRGYVDGLIHGYTDGDSDLFQFTPPVDVLAGVDGDTSDSQRLVVGGSFNSAVGKGSSGSGNINDELRAVLAANIASYDYGTFQGLVGSGPGVDELLFPDGSYIDGDVYAMVQWDRTIQLADGSITTQTVLVIGGDFVVRDHTDSDPTLDPTTDSLLSGLEDLVVWDGVQFSPLLPPSAKNDLENDIVRQGLNYDERLAWSLNGEVRALAVYDVNVDGQDDLVIGGLFTGVVTSAEGTAPSANLTGFEVVQTNDGIEGRWIPLNVDFSLARVNALQLYDPTSVGEDPEDFEEPELSLAVGQQDGTVTILEQDAPTSNVTSRFSLQAKIGTGDGAVYALTTHTPAPILVQDPGDPMTLIVFDLPEMLVIGGEFNRILNQDTESVFMWNGIVGNTAAWVEPMVALGGASFELQATGSNALPIVRALASWTPNDPTRLGTLHAQEQSFLVIGGEFATFDLFDLQTDGQTNVIQNVALWMRSIFGVEGDQDTIVQLDTWASLGGLLDEGYRGGFDGPVYSLSVYEDSEQAGGEAFEGQALVIGGDFSGLTLFDYNGDNLIDSNDANDMDAAGLFSTNLIYYDATNDLTYRAAAGGTDGPIYAATVFQPSRAVFLPNGRPLSTLQIRVNGVLETAIGDLDAAINLYDSNLQLVATGTLTDEFFDRQGPDNQRIPNDLAGTNDSSLYVEFDDVSGVTLWGGEVYYLEVYAQDGVFQFGRYTVEVMVDGFVDDNDFVMGQRIGTLDNLGSTFVEAADNTNHTGSPVESDLDTRVRPINIQPDNGRGYLGEAYGDGYNLRYFADRPNGSELRIGSRLPGINSYDDTDIFTFTALRDGYAEVFITTVNVRNQYRINGVLAGEKTYQSPLDPAVRIFNNNLTQIAFNDNIEGASTERQGLFSYDFNGDGDVNDLGEDITAKWTDSRVVFEVKAGQQYFIQIESAFLQQYLDYEAGLTDQMDWRHALGSYEIYINTGASPSGSIIPNGDDVVDFVSETTQQIGRAPLGFDASGSASFDGVIENRSSTPTRPADSDAFVFQAPGTGTATVSLARRDASFTGTIRVLRADTNTQITTVTANAATGAASVSFSVVGGTRYFVVVDGSNAASTGLYTLSVDVPVIGADEADYGDWDNAQNIPISVATNTGSINGQIQHGADVDIFKFTAPQFAEYRITLVSTSGLDLRLDVYEQQVSPLPISRAKTEIPVFTLVRAVADGTNGSPVAQFGATPSRLTTGASDRSGVGVIDISAYYIVVSQDIFQDASGSYTITIELVAPDDHPNAGQSADYTNIVLDTATGDGSQTGTFEIAGDTDQFRFTAPASGRVFLTASVTDGSSLRLAIDVYDVSGIVLLASANASVGGGDALTTFVASRDSSYLVVVRVANGEVDPLTGDYELAINATAADDHANAGEFAYATPIVLDQFSGDGMFPSSGGTRPQINPANDSDLFTFTTIALGSVTVTVTPFVNSAADQFTPLLTIFNASFTPIASAIALTPQGVATITIPAGSNVGGDVYYILVADARSTADAIDVSPYEITLDGPEIRANPNEVDFGDPEVTPDPDPTGLTRVYGGINQPGERVLYTFTVPARTRDVRVFVQLVAVDPSGNASPLDGQFDILFDSDPSTPITDESDPELMSILPGGVPTSADGVGTAARYEFTVAQAFMSGDAVTYYVIVGGVDINDGGDYRLDVVVEPTEFSYYMPEGWAGEGIREFVSLANPNDFNVTYTLTAYYENTSLSPVTIVSNAIIPAGSRGGVTLSDALLYNSVGAQSATGIFSSAGIRVGEGYSLVLTANGALAASSARYDFDSSTGATFTDQTSAQWSFARVERNPGVANDFVLVYNPNNFAIDVTFSVDAGDGTPVTITQTIQAHRRGGWNIDAENVLPTGVFGALVYATPTPTGDAGQDAANDAAFVGIVASQTHFESTVEGGRGFAALGDNYVGSLVTAIPTITDSSAVESEIVIYNPAPFDAGGATDATVTFRGDYLADGLPDFVRTYTIKGGDVLRLSDATLGLIANQPVGIEIISDRGVTVIGLENRYGEQNSVTAESNAAENWYFGDAFINTQLAGDFYLENLSFYNPNPGTGSLDITVTLLFYNADTGVIGESADITVTVDAGGFATLNLHEAPEILSRADPLVYYSLVVTADSPFVVDFYHYDLFLGGGWGVVGAPFGLLNPLSEIG